MKRVVRWVGIGITVAAAATMLMADMVLARPPALTQTAVTQTAVTQTTMQQPASAFATPVETAAANGYKDRNLGSR